MSLPLLVLALGFAVMGVIGMPVALAMLNSGVLYLLVSGQDLALAAEQILNGLFNSFVLLAVPLFIFAANVMTAGSISDRLLDFCTALVGRFRGGLAQVDILVSIVFSGMSGSAIADAAGTGKVAIEMMVKRGHYPAGFAAAVIAASATIGPIIPPSIPMVLYALVADTSVGYLFLGGVLPGLVMGGALMAVVAVSARRRGFGKGEAVPLRELPERTVRATPVLVLPVILLGGIYGGIVTPTEAAAVAALYAILLACVWYRSLSFKGLVQTFIDSARASAVVTLVVAGAFVFNYVVATEQVPELLAASLAGVDIPPSVFLLLVTVVFLLLGCFLDTTTLLLVLVPLLLPTLRQLGVDLVHFGVTITVNLMIGLITPPFGVLLFVVNGVTGIPLKSIIQEIWIFIAVLIAALVVMILVPETVLWLPRQFGYAG
ncbi:TRAP transporter large permease [Geminicoccaceae bacterium 1502E]|nr:TRAP transporter large permease [Geminicoccaceae bacterium 1502E]